jgi:putative methyltransferase (TIGR04325 family)
MKYKRYLSRLLNQSLNLIFNKFLYLINKLKEKLTENYTFEKKFSTYKEFLIFKNSFKISQSKLKNFKKGLIMELKKDRLVSITERFYVMTVFISAINKKKLNILEFGGYNNPIQKYIEKSTKKKITSTIIETKDFVKEINKKKISEKIKYLYSLKNINYKQFDICYFGASIQYRNDYEKILLNLFECNVKYIIITDTIFNKTNNNYFTLHNNDDFLLYPTIFFSYQKFLKLFEDNNYNLEFENKKIFKSYTHKTINKDEFFQAELIFIKK